jgi:hypothetical protein
MIDKNYCMSSFLTYRFVFDETKLFSEEIKRDVYPLPETKYMIRTSSL